MHPLVSVVKERLAVSAVILPLALVQAPVGPNENAEAVSFVEEVLAWSVYLGTPARLPR